MTNEWDAQLQTLFADSKNELDGEGFTDRVVAGTFSRRNRLIAGIAGMALVLAICIWVFNVPVWELVQQVSLVFTINLFDLGEGWVAWALSPVNNIAGVLLLSVKAIRILRKRALRSM